MIIADTNEFHPLVNGIAYRDDKEPDGSNHPIVIMRATYSTSRMDREYVSSLSEARHAGLLVGHYGYMTATSSAHEQGLFFANIVKSHGGIKPGDTIWCDAEEGSGDQTQRVLLFLGAAHSILHDDPRDEGIYSGASFWVNQLKTMPPARTLRWVAAYGQSDPNLREEDIWQFTDKKVMAGVSGPCDASIYKGSLESFKKLVTPPKVQSKGPYRHHVSQASQTIDHVAEARKTTVDAIAKISADNLNSPHLNIFNSYMLLRAALRANGSPSPFMPVGFVYWTAAP